jgi:GNAT superfamily N-acetyltransferase
MERAVLFLRDTAIPDAPGWPFSPELRMACLHSALATPLAALARGHSALTHFTEWDSYASRLDALPAVCPAVPELWAFGEVPEDQVALVLTTSTIPRQASTLRALPNVALFDAEGVMRAWAYVGIDCSFVTLYVLPEYRGRGLASAVGWMLLTKLRDGKFTLSYTVSDQGKDFQIHAYQGGNGGSNYVQADVDSENVGSKRTLEKLGLKALWRSSYIWVDSSKIP